MPQSIAPDQPTSLTASPASVYFHIVDTLRTLLPENDPKHLAVQLEAAIAEVGSYAPANAAANLAARYVAFSAHAEHCLHLAFQLESKGQLEWL